MKHLTLILLTMALLGATGCKKTERAAGIEVKVQLDPRFDLSLIDSVILFLDQAPQGPALNLSPGEQGGGSVNGITFTTANLDVDQDGALELAVTLVGNPFRERLFLFDFLSPGHATAPVSIRVFVKDSSGIIASSEIYQDGNGEPISFHPGQRKTMTLYISCREGVTCQGTPLNRNPQLVVPGAVSVEAGQKVQFMAAAVDPDGDTVQVTADLSQLPANSGAQFNEATLSFSWQTTTAHQGGPYAVPFRADDQRGGTVMERVELSVLPSSSNTTPVLAPIGPQTIGEGVLTEIPLRAVDADQGQTLTFCLYSGPSWVTVSGEGQSPGPVSGMLTFSPIESDVGQHTLVIRIIDGGTCLNPRAHDEETLTVTVQAAGNAAPKLAAIGPLTVDEDDILTVNLSATDADLGQILTFCLLSGPSWAQVAGHGPSGGLVGGTLTVTPGDNDAGNYSAVIRVLEGGTCDAPEGLYAEESVALTVRGVNKAPILAAIAPRTVDEGATLTVNLSATDADLGQTLTFCLHSGPGWAQVSGSGSSASTVNGTLTLNPGNNTAGTHLAVIRVIDGGTCSLPSGAHSETSVALTVRAVNVAPALAAIGPRTVDEEQRRIIGMSATDEDLGQTLLFCKVSGPAWAQVTGAGASGSAVSGMLTLSPGANDAGAHTVVVRVIDGGTCAAPTGLSTEESVAVTVNAINAVPELEEIDPQSIDEGTTTTVDLEATDADSDQTLTFCKVSGPEWAEVSGSGPSSAAVEGSLTLNPGANDAGVYTVVVRVIDGGTCWLPAAFADRTVAITVRGAGNTPPQLAAIGPRTVAESGQLTVNLSATDADADQTLTFCLEYGPSWASVSGQGQSPGPVAGTLILNPGTNDAGVHMLVVRVIDGGTCAVPLGLQAREQFAVTVTGSNAKPVLANLAPQSIDEGAMQEVPLSATDPDLGQTLIFCKVSGPEWAQVTGAGSSNGTANGKLSLSPGPNDAGTYSVLLQVIDGGTCETVTGLSDEATVVVTVREVNSTPRLEAVEPQTIVEGATRTVELEASDPDEGQTLTFCKVSGPEWAEVLGSGESGEMVEGTLTLKPGHNAVGDYEVVLKVIDSGNCSSKEDFTELRVPITVEESNVPPRLSAIGSLTVEETGQLTANLSATDPDDFQTLTFCLAFGPTWAVVSGSNLSPGPVSGTLFLTPGANDAGVHTLGIKVIDGGTCEAPLGLYAEERITVTVTETNTAPMLSFIGPEAVDEEALRAIDLSATDDDQGQLLTFCLVNPPPWASVSGYGVSPGPVNGTLTLTPGPNDAGTYSLVVQVIDSGTCEAPLGLKGEETVPVTVSATNSTPKLETIGDRTMDEASELTVNLSATDPDLNQTLTFCMVSGPTWAEASGSGLSGDIVGGTLTLRPATGDWGVHMVKVKVIDGGTCQNPTAYDEKELAVTVKETNAPPLLAAIGPQSVEGGQLLAVNLSASDPNPFQILTFCKVSGPDWATLSGSGLSGEPVTGTLMLSPETGDVGQHTVVVRVIDGGTCAAPEGLSDEESVQVTVSGPNQDPVLAAIGPHNLGEGAVKLIGLSATDPDPYQILSFCKVSGPAWVTVSGYAMSPGPVSGELKLAPGANDKGSYTVVVSVIDGGTCAAPTGLSDEESVLVIVTETNSPPVLTAIGDQTLEVGSVSVVELSALDPDIGQTTTFCKYSGPDWAAVVGSGSSNETVKGTLTLSPAPGDEGSYEVLVRVIDGGTCATPTSYAEEYVLVTATIPPPWSNEVKFKADTPSSYEYFGQTVSIDGDYAAIGCPAEKAVYIYRRTGDNVWDKIDKLLAPSGAVYYGTALSISSDSATGDFVIVGAPRTYSVGSYGGKAYVYRRCPEGESGCVANKWTKMKTLVAPDAEANDQFGSSVSIQRSYAVVGAPYEDAANTNAGSAYIYYGGNYMNTWDFHEKIFDPGAGANDNFGKSVANHWYHVIVGAPNQDEAASNAGAVYVFKVNYFGGTWDAGTKLMAPEGDADATDQFGGSVGIAETTSGTFAIVGAMYDDEAGYNAGAAYIFRKYSSSWDAGSKFMAPDPKAGQYFGNSVALSFRDKKATNAIVGAYIDPEKAPYAGAAYIFGYTGPGNVWDAGTKLMASDAAGSAYFGVSVSISDNYAIVGADKKDFDGYTDAGGAYIYKK